MCRLVAYLSEKSIVLDEVLSIPENSLIKQSKSARLGPHGVNADGFGIGWYNFKINNKPALFKSIQPAWNDDNLEDISAKVKSHCFVGHVRASTVGDVAQSNCHPFRYENYLFAHNGTIKGFPRIRKKIINHLSEDSFALIKGQTDSETFFALVVDYLDPKLDFINRVESAVRKAIEKILELKAEIGITEPTKLNTVFTDGNNLVATRYTSNLNEEALTLYYAISGLSDGLENKYCLIASEPLTDCISEWHGVANNSFISINKKLDIDIAPI